MPKAPDSSAPTNCRARSSLPDSAGHVALEYIYAYSALSCDNACEKNIIVFPARKELESCTPFFVQYLSLVISAHYLCGGPDSVWHSEYETSGLGTMQMLTRLSVYDNYAS
jgi:hypothetical protein